MLPNNLKSEEALKQNIPENTNPTIKDVIDLIIAFEHNSTMSNKDDKDKAAAITFGASQEPIDITLIKRVIEIHFLLS